MATTRANISALIVSWLDDLQQAYFTPAQVNVWINNAQRQVQQELLQAGNNWYMVPVETQTVSSQTDYVLPSDFIFLHRLELVISGTGTSEDRRPVMSITTNEQNMVPLSNGVPSNFYIKKDRITVLPAPSQTWTLRLYYSPIVQDLQFDTDVPNVPEQFMEYLAILACYDGFIKDDRAPDNLIAKKAQYQEMVRKMAVDRTQDQPRSVVNVQDSDYSGYY